MVSGQEEPTLLSDQAQGASLAVPEGGLLPPGLAVSLLLLDLQDRVLRIVLEKATALLHIVRSLAAIEAESLDKPVSDITSRHVLEPRQVLLGDHTQLHRLRGGVATAGSNRGVFIMPPVVGGPILSALLHPLVHHVGVVPSGKLNGPVNDFFQGQRGAG